MRWTEESRRKQSLARTGTGNPMWGKKKSLEATTKQRAAVSGSKHYRWNPNREEVARKKKQRGLMYGLLWRVLRRSGTVKSGHADELLGYSTEQLRDHLEKQFVEGMTWENHGTGPGTWQVDHVRPVNQFPLDASPDEVNALSNLRPLWYDENIRRARKGTK